MRKAAFGSAGWLVALLAMVGFVARGAAQPGAPEGAFLRGPDGTVFAVSNGTRIRIAPADDTSGVLGSLSDGPAVANVRELNDAIAAAAPPPPPPANPAQTLVGQRTSTCFADARFDVEVVRGEWVRTLGGEDAPGNAMWAVAIVDITLTSNSPSSQPGNGAVKVQDERGREFINSKGSLLMANGAAEYGVGVVFDIYSPGITKRTLIAFPVAPDAQRLTLLPDPFLCQL